MTVVINDIQRETSACRSFTCERRISDFTVPSGSPVRVAISLCDISRKYASPKHPALLCVQVRDARAQARAGFDALQQLVGAGRLARQLGLLFRRPGVRRSAFRAGCRARVSARS
jgi:hypothetical protein